MSKAGEQISVILLAIVGVAVLALVVSKQANTSAVISAATQGFSTALGAALSPVTGSTSALGSFGSIH